LIFKGLRGSPEANCPVDYAGLLRMAAGQNKFGGGQGSFLYFTPTIRVPLRAPKLVRERDLVII